MYILASEPASGIRAEAFAALDDAFGTEEFSRGQALTVISNALGTNGEAAFRDLENSDCITETGED